MPEKKTKVIDREPISEAEAQAIFSACAGLSDRPQYNQHWGLMFKGLWYSGLRVNELLAVTWELVEPGVLIVRPLKTRAAFELIRKPVPSFYTEELIAFPLLHHFRARGRVFPWHHTHVRRVLDRVSSLAGIGRELNPHLFRHGYGHHAAASLEAQGMNVVKQVQLLKGLLGHRGTGTDSVARYQRPTSREVEDAARKMFPEP